MNNEDFRNLALSLPDAEERSHMNHPDFRVNGKIFATLPNPDNGQAMVKLPPDQQAAFMELDPKSFVPVKGGWGRQGCTNVVLSSVKEKTLRGALTMAWQSASQKKAAKKKAR